MMVGGIKSLLLIIFPNLNFYGQASQNMDELFIVTTQARPYTWQDE